MDGKHLVFLLFMSLMMLMLMLMLFGCGALCARIVCASIEHVGVLEAKHYGTRVFVKI